MRGESMTVAFQGLGEGAVSTSYRVRFSDDGRTLYFADQTPVRTTIELRSLELGETIESLRIRNDAGVTLENSVIHVRYKKLPGAPRSTDAVAP